MSVSRDDREDLTMAMITNDWLTALGGEFHKPYYRQLFEFVKNEYNTTVVFPPADDIFNVNKHIINLNQTRFPITTNQTIAFKAYEYKKELHIFYIDCLRK